MNTKKDSKGKFYPHNLRKKKETEEGKESEDDKLSSTIERREGPRRELEDRRLDIRFEDCRRTNSGRRKTDFDMRDFQKK